MPERVLRVVLVGDERDLTRAVGKSKAELSGLAGSFQKNGQRMVRTGQTLTRNITLPVVAAGAASVKLAVDFDTSMNHVQALTGASAKQTEEWSNQILDLAPNLGAAPNDLAKALYFVASSGAKVNQVMPITVASAKAAAAGMGDAETVAQLLTSAMNAYGPKALSAAKATDILTAAVKIGKAEPEELAAEMGKLIPNAQAMGVSFAEAATLTSELTNTGLDAATATTALRNVIGKIIAPTAGATKELNKIGLSVSDLQTEVKTKGLLATLQDLSDRVHGNRQAMHELFPDARGLTAVFALTGQNGDAAAKALDKVEHSTGALDKAFKTAQHGPGFQLHKTLAELEVDGIKIGNDLLPVVGRIAHAVGEAADAFSHLSKGEQDAILVAAGIAAAAGPILTMAGNMMKLAVALKLVGTRAPVAAAGMEATEGAAAGSAAAIGPLVPLLFAAAAGYELWTHRTKSHITVSDQFKHSQSQLNDQIRTGQMSVSGWNAVIARSTNEARGMGKSLREVRASGSQFSDLVGGPLRANVANFIGQMRATAAQTEAASHDTEHFGASARRQYAHVAALARTSADLAAAMHSIPSLKQVQLIVSITEQFKTEGIAPGMGGDESSHQGPGGHYHPPSTKGPTSGTGQGGGKVVLENHIYLDGREITRSIRSRNRVSRRQVGRDATSPR